MEIKTQEIYQVLDELLANIGLQLAEYDITFLMQAEIYVEMFKVMFPTLVPLLDIDFSQEDVNDQELIQSLVDFLSKYIIKMDLDHISGELITKGDPKHILNFLQLLSEISKMIIPKEGEEEEEETEGESEERREGKGQQEKNQQMTVDYERMKGDKLFKSSPASWRGISDQSRDSLDEWKEEKYNTAIGIPGEFNNEPISKRNVQYSQVDEGSYADEETQYLAMRNANNMHNTAGKEKVTQDPKKQPGKQESLRNSYSGSRISEVSKSKECSDYEMTAKKLSGVDHQFEDFGPKTDPERQRRLEGRINGEVEWHQEDEEGDEEIVEEAEEEEDDDHHQYEENRHKRKKDHGKLPRGYEAKRFEEDEGEEAESNQHYQEDYEEGELEEEELEEEEEYQSYPMQKVTKESENYEDAVYYASDPINYQSSNKRGSSRDYEEHEEESDKQEEQEEEEYQALDPHNMIQEEEEEENGTEQSHPKDEAIEAVESYHHQLQSRAGHGKAKKTRPVTSKAHKLGRVEYRPLRPTTATVGSLQYQNRLTQSSKSKNGIGKVKAIKAQQRVNYDVKQTSNKNNLSADKISERSRESTGNDRDGFHGIQQDSRRGGMHKGTHKGERIDNSIFRHNGEQASKDRQMRYTERKPIEKKIVKQSAPIKIKGDSLKKAYEDQQKMLYYSIRDNKLNYLKKIHTIIYQLEKEKIKEEKEAQKNYRKAQEEATVNVLLAIKKNYQEKLKILKQGYQNERNERKINDMAQHTFLKTLSHELRLDQMKEIERLRDRLAREKARFDLMTRDDKYLETKIAQLYQK